LQCKEKQTGHSVSKSDGMCMHYIQHRNIIKSRKGIKPHRHNYSPVWPQSHFWMQAHTFDHDCGLCTPVAICI